MVRASASPSCSSAAPGRPRPPRAGARRARGEGAGFRDRAAAAAAAAVAALSMGLLAAPTLAASGGKGYSVPLSGEDFSYQDKRGEDYTKAVLRKVNFTGADLRCAPPARGSPHAPPRSTAARLLTSSCGAVPRSGATFFGALARDAVFKDADMRLADLEQCNFEGADLTNAVLEGAAVNAAEFSETTIIEVRRARTRPSARPHGAAADSAPPARPARDRAARRIRIGRR